MRKVYFFLVGVIFLSVSSAMAQSAKATPSPKPTPLQYTWHYSATLQDMKPDPAGDRKFIFEIDLGSKSKSQNLLDEVREAGIPARSAIPTGFVVTYPETMDDCHILYDVWRTAVISTKYFKKNLKLEFDASDLGGEGHYYQIVPPKCDFLFKSAARLPIAAFLLFWHARA